MTMNRVFLRTAPAFSVVAFSFICLLLSVNANSDEIQSDHLLWINNRTYLSGKTVYFVPETFNRDRYSHLALIKDLRKQFEDSLRSRGFQVTENRLQANLTLGVGIYKYSA